MSDPVLEGFIHPAALQVRVSPASPLVEMKIMTAQSTERKELKKMSDGNG